MAVQDQKELAAAQDSAAGPVEEGKQAAEAAEAAGRAESAKSQGRSEKSGGKGKGDDEEEEEEEEGDEPPAQSEQEQAHMEMLEPDVRAVINKARMGRRSEFKDLINADPTLLSRAKDRFCIYQIMTYHIGV